MNIAFALGAMADSGRATSSRCDVDLTAKIITVRAQADRNSGEEREPKSGKPRKVPILTGSCRG